MTALVVKKSRLFFFPYMFFLYHFFIPPFGFIFLLFLHNKLKDWFLTSQTQTQKESIVMFLGDTENSFVGFSVWAII